MKLVSACLLGTNCRYDCKSNQTEEVMRLSEKEILIPVCPEQLGGLSTPRNAGEIQGYSGENVLNGKCKVIDTHGEDSTEQFIRGAYEVLKIAKLYGITEAILKQRSPSCGSGQIYDGTFSEVVIEGDGVTTALLKRNGINVLSEEDI